MSDGLRYATAPRATDEEGISEWSVLLESGSPNPYLRPEAQTIRLQEKLLEKVEKFPAPVANIFSIIVVDCSSFRFGHFDGEDCRMVMYGKTRNAYLQELWDGDPIIGLLNDHYDKKGAKEFRERITAVIFVPDISIHDSFGKAFIVLNEHRPEDHLKAVWLKLKKHPVLHKTRYAPPVP